MPGASPGCSGGASPGRCEAGSGAAGGLLQKETPPPSANGAEGLAAAVRCGEGTPREGGDALPERSACGSPRPDEMLIVSPSAPASGAGFGSCLLLLRGTRGSLPLGEKRKNKPNVNPVGYAKQTWPVFPTERASAFGKRENAARALPRSVRGCFGQESRCRLGRGEPPFPRSCGTHGPALLAWGLETSSAGPGGGKVRLPEAAGAAGAARVAPGGVGGVGGKVRQSPRERLKALLRQA